jgi:hypothetical protein
MASQYVHSALEQHQFDWETFDAQPVRIKQVTWDAVGSDVHWQWVIPAMLAEAVAARGERILAARRAELARLAYGPDHPEAKQ